jgi:hypothetical protein
MYAQQKTCDAGLMVQSAFPVLRPHGAEKKPGARWQKKINCSDAECDTAKVRGLEVGRRSR